MFFWLLTNRMAPALFFSFLFFSSIPHSGLLTPTLPWPLPNCLFNVPLAVWILEGFMSGVPKEIDETAYIDGYTFPKFFITIFLPLIRSGVGVTAFFCFMFSWVELLFARTLTTQTQNHCSHYDRTVSATGLDWGLLAAARMLNHCSGGPPG